MPSKPCRVFRHGVVATSHPAAARAGVEVLRDGGSAVDAAITTAAALTVLEPTSNGLGGDAFALIWDGGRLHGYNGSGRAPALLDVDTVAAAGHTTMPQTGWLSVTVPGQLRAWADLHARFGRLPWPRLLAPAIRFADTGHPVPPVIARHWAQAVAVSRPDGSCRGFADTFTVHGRAPAAGESLPLPGHARTLRVLSEAGADDFYTGRIATAVVDFAERTGGLLSAEDLRRHTGEWVRPITADYRGHTVAELPPNGQGVAALQALAILDGLPAATAQHPADLDDPDRVHLYIEAMKLAFADAFGHVGDPTGRCLPDLLDPGYIAHRRAQITGSAAHPVAGSPPPGGTVYLCVAAPDGQQVSFIQSNYHGFGSGVVVPGWGIALHNRGAGFVLDDTHPNRLTPGRRPFHTIIPGFLLRDGDPVGPFGVMGGHMQAQGHLQVMIRTSAGQQPQAALDAPRWRVQDGAVLCEPTMPPTLIAGLRARGHRVRVVAEGFGRGQVIWRNGAGWLAGSESRCDGDALGW